MKVLIRKIFFLVFILIVVNNGNKLVVVTVAEDDSESSHRVDTMLEQLQPVEPSDRSERFITYLAAIQRVDRWKEHVSVVAKLTRDIEILGKFGLASIADIEQFLILELEVQDHLKQLTFLKENSYEAFFVSNVLTSETEAILHIRTVLPPQSLVDVSLSEINREALSLLKQALSTEEQAYQSAVSAHIQHESGIITTEQYLNAHKTYIQASILTIDAREAFNRSLINIYLDNTGEPLGLISLMNLFDQLDEFLVGEWRTSIRNNMIKGGPVVNSDTAVSFLTVPIEISFLPMPMITHSGEVFIPLRAYAEALHYEVLWESALEQVTLTTDHHHIVMTINDKQIYRNELAIELSTEPIKQNGATYVPLSFFPSVLGVDVYWDERNRQGLILR